MQLPYRVSIEVRFAWAASSLLICSAAHPGAPAYSIALASGPDCGHSITAIYPVDLGSSIAVGFIDQCDTSTEEWGFTWDGSSAPQLIPLPPGAVSMTANGIGPTGLIVLGIDFVNDAFGYLGYTLDVDGVHLLPIPRGASYTGAAGTNGPWVVGSWGNPKTGPFQRAIVWDLNSGTATDLIGTYGNNSAAIEVNALGHVCGWMGSSDLVDSHGFLLADGIVTDLGTIPGGLSAIPQAINSSDTIVGQGVLFDPFTRLFHGRGYIWSEGRMTIIEPPPGYGNSSLRDINDKGDAVGRFWNYPSGLPEVGFLLRNGKITLMSEFVPAGLNLEINFPKAITNDGRILASGDLDLFNVAILLTPIPPSSDLDGDGAVGGGDLAILLGSWGPCDECAADLDENTVVDAADLAILLGDWSASGGG